MFTSTHGFGRDQLRPTALSAAGESSVARLSRFEDQQPITRNFATDMMLSTVNQDSHYGLGPSPRACEARVDAFGIMLAADAVGDRTRRHRTAGIGRGGHAP